MMRCLILTFSIVLLFSIFSVFSIDNDQYLLMQEQLKHTADDCSAAAMLYYDKDFFSQGQKVFDQTAGNRAIAYISEYNLEKQPDEYYAYYFDGNGRMTAYRGMQMIKQEEGITYPYMFEERLTGYKFLVNEPQVVVTIDSGIFDYRLKFVPDQRLIRTSGYEYVGG